MEETGLKYLKHYIKSKGKEIDYSKLEMRHYFESYYLLTLQEKKEAFKIRTRMTDIKTNFKNKFQEYNCIACEKENIHIEETQEQIYVCKNIKENYGEFVKIFENN